MSTVSQAPKVNTARTLKISNVNLLVIAALVLGVAVVVANAAAPAAKPIDHSAYILYRQGEWVSVPIPVDSAEAYRIYRQGEVTSPMSNAEAYLIHRLGEWASVAMPAVDLTAYHLSERTLVDPQAGMAAYFNSERTRVPVLFTKYQRSEWFGK